MNKVIWILLLIPLVSASSAYLPNQTAIGYPYYFNASITTSDVTSCIINAYTNSGVLVQTWSLDGKGFPLLTDKHGYIHSYIVTDNSLLTGRNYTFALSCKDFVLRQTVLIDVGGNSRELYTAQNIFTWIQENPMASLILSVVSLIVLLYVKSVIDK